MLKVFARTREREQAWRLGAYSLGGSLLGAPIVVAIFEGAWGFRHPFEVCGTCHGSPREPLLVQSYALTRCGTTDRIQLLPHP